MCGLCGAFGVAGHWSDGLAGPGGMALRRHRARVANQVLQRFGLTLHDWANRFTLRSRTGKIAIVDHYGAIWPAAEKLYPQGCDPLDPDLIRSLEAKAAGAPPPAS
jgi:hypothetical protein